MQRITTDDGELLAVPTKAHWAAIKTVRAICHELAYIEFVGEVKTDRGEAAARAASELVKVLIGEPREEETEKKPDEKTK